MTDASAAVEPERISLLRDRPVRRSGRYVLYWMQAAQRAEDNPALDLAVCEADRLGLPVLAAFGLTADYPEANARHYRFLLEGLAGAAEGLKRRGVGFVLRRGEPWRVAGALAGEAACVVCDRGYLAHQRSWRRKLARAIDCRAHQVEADVLVPLAVASGKAEYAARTLRPRHGRHWDRFLRAAPDPAPKISADSRELPLSGEDPADVDGLLDALKTDASVPPVAETRGGLGEARRRLARFLDGGLHRYADHRSDPANQDIPSGLSPYLHFGQISPREIARAVRGADAPPRAREAFLEELLIRRELAMNYVAYTRDYDRFAALPAWARRTLEAHSRDRRPYVYTHDELEAGKTHDRYWNAAMQRMRRSGTLHNTLRMYWGKKVIEWTRRPRTAFRWLLEWNNRYFLDGRDASSWTNVAWCFGLHDRPWAEREVFGTVRYMNEAGLERKYDMDRWMEQVAAE